MSTMTKFMEMSLFGFIYACLIRHKFHLIAMGAYQLMFIRVNNKIHIFQ